MEVVATRANKSSYCKNMLILETGADSVKHGHQNKDASRACPYFYRQAMTLESFRLR
jgi:hypothetical protein